MRRRSEVGSRDTEQVARGRDHAEVQAKGPAQEDF